MFSPVTKITILQVPLVLLVNKDWKLGQLNMKNAFLNGELNREFYMDQPKKFENKVGVISQYMQSLKKPHLDAARQTLRYVKVIANDGRDAWEVLERGSNDDRLSPQSVTNAKPRREDATRGLVQQEASGTSSLSVRLRRIHEGSTSPPRQARSQEAKGCLHRL